MKILKYIFIAIIWFAFAENILSQYYLKAKSDSISLKIDSVLLFVDGYRGTINWQVSSDLVNWISLNKSNDSLGVRIDSSAYYRATIIEGTCNPVISDTAYLIEKLTITNSHQFTVDSLGGVFLLPSGVKVKVPKRAVTAPKEIKLDVLGFDDANALATINVSENATFLAGISFATNMFDFQETIKIKIPLQGLKSTGIPLLYELSNASNSWLISNEMMIISMEDQFVEIIFKGLNQKGITYGTKSALDLNSIRNLFIKFYDAIFLSEDPCRKNNGIIVTEDYDKIGNDECSVVNVKLKAVFTDCKPEQVEPSTEVEIAPSCKPELKIVPDGGKIKKDESLSITLTASIGGLPLENQEIKLSTSGNLLITKPLIFTGSDGSKSLSVQGIEVGDGNVTISVTFKYDRTHIYSEANGIKEDHPFDHEERKKEYTINVKVYDVPEVTTNTITDIDGTSAIVGGNVVRDNYDPVTERGIYLGTTSEDTEISWSKIQIGSGTGSYSTKLLGLIPDETYFVKAYAINNAGTSYGNEMTFIAKRPQIVLTIMDGPLWTPENHILSVVPDAVAKLYKSQETFDSNLPDFTETSDVNGIVKFYVPIQEQYYLVVEKGALSNIDTQYGYVIVGVIDDTTTLENCPYPSEYPRHIGGFIFLDYNIDFLINALDQIWHDIIFVYENQTTTRTIYMGEHSPTF